MTKPLANVTTALKGKKLGTAAADTTTQKLTNYEWLLHYHLKQGFDLSKPEHVDFSQSPAIKFMGVAKDTKPTQRSDWEFGILQFAKIPTFEMRFAGFADKEGSIEIDVTRAPGFRSVTLDTPLTDARFPFCHFDPVSPGTSDPIIVSMRDHPNGSEVMRMLNSKTYHYNYLRSFQQAVEFTVVFSARTQASPHKWEHLLTSSWEASWRLTVRWAPEGKVFKPTVSGSKRLRVSSSSSTGAPGDSQIRSLLSRLNSLTHADTTNAIMGRAVKAAKSPSNRRDLTHL